MTDKRGKSLISNRGKLLSLKFKKIIYSNTTQSLFLLYPPKYFRFLEVFRYLREVNH